eukprot:9366131-Lingulodinium_polyedra.AAC.1
MRSEGHCCLEACAAGRARNLRPLRRRGRGRRPPRGAGPRPQAIEAVPREVGQERLPPLGPGAQVGNER